VIYLRRRFRQQIAERIVADAGKMRDRVDAREVAGPELADIGAKAIHAIVGVAAEGAPLVKHTIEPNHVVPGFTKQANKHGADVTTVTGDENSHCSHSHVFQGALPADQSSSSLCLSRSVSMHCQKEGCL